MKNDDDDENNDKNEDIKNGLLDDFNDLILFGFSENPFKAQNLSIDRRFKTVFWFRPTVCSKTKMTGCKFSFLSRLIYAVVNLTHCLTQETRFPTPCYQLGHDKTGGLLWFLFTVI